MCNVYKYNTHFTVFLFVGLAIGIHNFPEGLATFVAALSSPSLGIALAIAIALHNIPEGVCVSMPVYYATGKKWKGFLWAFLSGVSEPFGESYTGICTLYMYNCTRSLMCVVCIYVYICIAECH